MLVFYSWNNTACIYILRSQDTPELPSQSPHVEKHHDFQPMLGEPDMGSGVRGRIVWCPLMVGNGAFFYMFWSKSMTIRLYLGVHHKLLKLYLIQLPSKLGAVFQQSLKCHRAFGQALHNSPATQMTWESAASVVHCESTGSECGCSCARAGTSAACMLVI